MKQKSLVFRTHLPHWFFIKSPHQQLDVINRHHSSLFLPLLATLSPAALTQPLFTDLIIPESTTVSKPTNSFKKCHHSKCLLIMLTKPRSHSTTQSVQQNPYLTTRKGASQSLPHHAIHRESSLKSPCQEQIHKLLRIRPSHEAIHSHPQH